MAYNLKYQSATFYNYFKKAVVIRLYKKDYVGSVVTVRVKDVSIFTNYQDNTTPIIGTGAKLRLLNDTNTFTAFDDLLTSKEKEFKCTVTVANQVVFTGFSLCDLNEQQFLPKAVITIQFTDYLRRLEDKYLSDLPSALGYASPLSTLVKQALNMIDIGFTNLLVNSSIYETRMTKTISNSFLNQAYVENELFLDKDNKQDDVYTILNKILTSFNCHLYSYDQFWVIERTEDIERETNWQSFDLGSETIGNTTARVATLHKQDGDFSYIDMSQVLKYYTGIHTLVLNISDKRKDSLITNSLDAATSIPDNTFYPAKMNTWYMGGDPYQFYRLDGVNKRGVNKWFQWSIAVPNNIPPTEKPYYWMRLYPNTSGKTILSISYKMFVPIFYPAYNDSVELALRIDCRQNTMYWVALLDDNIAFHTNASASHSVYLKVEHKVDKEDLTPNVTTWTFSKEIDFTSLLASNPFGFPYIDYIFQFQAIKYIRGGTTGYFVDNVIGDFQIQIKDAPIDNQYTYNLSDAYIKEEKVEIALCDANSESYVNGLLLPVNTATNEFTRTVSWTSDNGNTRILQDKIAEEWYRKYSDTNRMLLSDIAYDGYLKLFTVFTDDNIKDSLGNNVKFVLLNYTWDVVSGTYTIELEEYPNEEIIINPA